MVQHQKLIAEKMRISAGKNGVIYCLEGGGHNLRSVVDGENNVSNTGGGQSFDLVKDHGPVAELDQWLREGEGERAQTGAEATDENESLHGGSCVLGV